MMAARDTNTLLRRAREGDSEAVQELLDRHRERLLRMVRFRIEEAGKRGPEPSRIVDEALLEASRRISEYSSHSSQPFLLWLRSLVRERLLALGINEDPHRRILLHRGPLPQARSEELAGMLLGVLGTAGRAAMRAMMRVRLQEALNSLDPAECEVLCLRHFEQLSLKEVACEMGVEESEIRRLYVRALRDLREALDRSGGEAPGGIR